ncbi:hypothetical protein ABB37_03185 [Leptomonas pyrrhocoris]|uniref:Uncharacterized protein n=1 Tax=Leptomonas pyrrhocoris TaxID=157538 RepID=A0A0M9G4L2_LEPPY|nr:hypothetical protein ABB37_03185 [Leptomonas pyrrhocoris]KPA82009.1 hypothetical protein ABB37_03185 [Leptomonas pyrrhocoris]|eukprot:XP_015660448.1 hypothetical protein ABB37_03185 [Leptomonas pyrrhocoris]
MQQSRSRFRASNEGLPGTSTLLDRRSGGGAFSASAADPRAPSSKPNCNPLHLGDLHGHLTSSYDADEGDTAADLQAGHFHSSGRSSPSPPPTPQPFPTLSNSVLARVQSDYPAVYAALRVYEKALRHHRERFQAKETELLRCIGVGEELLEQIDALKERCETLARERDEAVTSAGTLTTSEQVHERAATAVAETMQMNASRAAEAATRAWDEERRALVEQYEAQCLRFREQLQDALQQASNASVEQRELESTLQQTRAQLHQTEEQLRKVETAYQERESFYATQRNRETQQQQLWMKQQVAQLQQQADVDKETVLAEATVELERLQRALVRAEKELKEQQRSAERPVTLLAEPGNATTLEIARLRRQIRQLEDINHDLQTQLRSKKFELRPQGGADEGRLVALHGHSMNSGAMPSSSNKSPVFGFPATDSHQQTSFVDDSSSSAVVASSSASLQRRLQEENARLRDKLQEVVRQAQDDVDKAHEARLELQQQLRSAAAQMQLLRGTVIAGLEEELRQAREQLDAAEAHGRDLQEVADAFEVRAVALQKEQAETASQLDAEHRACERLQQELCEAKEMIPAVQQRVETTLVESQHKDALIVRLQREKQQLVVALRTLQAQTGTIEEALSAMRAKHEEGTAQNEMNTARLQERCVLLEHELAEAKEERVALCGRLRDAEEAVDVLKDAQRIANESVRDAQRGTQEAKERAHADLERLQQQQQVCKSRATEAEQELSQLHNRLREMTQREREHQEELLRKEEALRQSTDKTTSLTTELHELRAMLSSREEAARERWRQQYAQNTADREQLLANKERQIEALQEQQRELRQTLTKQEERQEQLQQQRQQTQAALSEAVASTAAYKGRIQALEEELGRLAKERADAKAELRRLSERYERMEATGATAAGADTSAASRITELETKLTEYDVELRNAERQRQQAQKTLLQLILTSPTDATQLSRLGNGNGRGWNDLVEVFDDAVNKFEAQSAFDFNAKRIGESGGGNVKAASGSSALPDACQRAASAVLRAIRDWIERLHGDDDQRWAALKNAVLTAYAAPKKAEEREELADAHDTPPPPSSIHKEGRVYTAEELRDRLTAANKCFATTLNELRTQWASANAELAKTSQLLQDEQNWKAEVEQLQAGLSAKEAECAATQTALDDARKKYADALHTTASLQTSVDQLRQDLAEREGRLAELEHRLEVRTAEIQAERAEWVAKWQEGQRHRERENADHEDELRALRTRLVAAEDATTASAGELRRQSEEAQRQLRAQLQDLQRGAATTEASLHQQVNALTQEKARVTQGLLTLKKAVVGLEERVNTTEAALKAKEVQLATAEKALHDIKKAHKQTLANGAAAEAFGQESMTSQIASLQSQLQTSRQESESITKTHAAAKAELLALRKVNASLESRLAEVEEDRAPLRRQLHSLLSFAEK